MTGVAAAATLLAAMPDVAGIEPWVVTGAILGGSLLAICVLYVVVRFWRPGDEQ